MASHDNVEQLGLGGRRPSASGQDQENSNAQAAGDHILNNGDCNNANEFANIASNGHVEQLGLGQRRPQASGQDQENFNEPAAGDHILNNGNSNHSNEFANMASHDLGEQIGLELFGNFVHHEIEQAGLAVEKDIEQQISPVVGTPATNKSVAGELGDEMQVIADDFAKTAGRKVIHKKANSIPLSEISGYNQFFDLLSSLFSDGEITRERIVVLFFFCSDLAIRTLKNKAMDYFKRFIKWSIRYISYKVCTWVHFNGGWGAVLSNAAEHVAASANAASANAATQIFTGVTFTISVIIVFNWFRNK